MKTLLSKVIWLAVWLVTTSTLLIAQNVPEAPSDFTATTDTVNDQITLTWSDNSDNESGFVIQKEWSTEEDHNVQFNIAANQTSFTDTDIEPNVSYYYSLWAENDFGISSDVAVTGILSLPTPPVPSNFNVITGPMTSVQLTFVDNSNLETGYEIQNSYYSDFYPEYQIEYTTGGSLNDVKTYFINDGPFSDPNGPHYYGPNTRIYARVRGFYLYKGHRVYGDYTPVASAKTHDVPASPSDFSAHISGDSVIVTWTNNADNAAALIMGIYEDDFNPNFATIFKLSANVNSYYHQGADPHIAYHYRLATIDAYENEMARDDFWDSFISNNSRYVETVLQPLPSGLVAPVITEIVGSSPMAVRIIFYETNDAPNHAYIVRYSTTPDGPYEEDWIEGATLGDEIIHQTNSGFEPNTLMYVKVAAVIYDNEGNITTWGPFSETLSEYTTAGWPPAPTDFTATAEGTHVKLTWTDNSLPDNPLNETAWGIMRADGLNGGNFTKSYRIPADVTFFIDNEVLPNHSYTYRIESIDAYDNSFDVYFTTITTPPLILPPPTAKLASFVTSTTFVANWKPVPNAERYAVDVYNITNSNIFITAETTDTTLYLEGLKSYKRYSYVVRAIAYGTPSPNSNSILITSIKNLILNPRCSDNPDVYRRWEVINNNIVPVEARWHVNNTEQYGSLIALPGSTFFTTQRISGTNKTTLSYYDDEYVTHTSEKGSPFTPCSNSSGRAYTEDELFTETELPFSANVYPNPATDRFKIKITSSSDSEAEIKILNLQGTQVFTKRVASNTTVEVDASQYSSGMYLIRVIQDRKQKLIKILKE